MRAPTLFAVSLAVLAVLAAPAAVSWTQDKPDPLAGIGCLGLPALAMISDHDPEKAARNVEVAVNNLLMARRIFLDDKCSPDQRGRMKEQFEMSGKLLARSLEELGGWSGQVRVDQASTEFEDSSLRRRVDRMKEDARKLEEKSRELEEKLRSETEAMQKP